MSDSLLSSRLDDALAQIAPGRCVWVALSGGLDSTLMLHLAAPLATARGLPLRAIHVNHGLQAAATTFETHCRRCCTALDVALTVVSVDVVRTGQGIEAAAREARYRAFADTLGQGDRLWLAQHADDQAETFLLAALRGSGVRGLAGMPRRRGSMQFFVERPWLDFTRRDIRAVAECRELEWCKDPTNEALAFDRNYLRARVVPALRARWPHTAEALGRAAAHAGEADALLEDLAAIDLASAGGDPACLSADALVAMSEARQRLLIRHALRRLELPLLPAARLVELIRQLAAAGVGRAPHVAWPGAEARLWDGKLHLMAPLEPSPDGWSTAWDGVSPLVTPGAVYRWVLEPEDVTRRGALRVTLRAGGETLRVAGRGRRDVKRLLQEARVPPWRRDRIPLVWHDGELVAIPGVATAAGWRLRPH